MHPALQQHCAPNSALSINPVIHRILSLHLHTYSCPPYRGFLFSRKQPVLLTGLKGTGIYFTYLGCQQSRALSQLTLAVRREKWVHLASVPPDCFWSSGLGEALHTEGACLPSLEIPLIISEFETSTGNFLFECTQTWSVLPRVSCSEAGV